MGDREIWRPEIWNLASGIEKLAFSEKPQAPLASQLQDARFPDARLMMSLRSVHDFRLQDLRPPMNQEELSERLWDFAARVGKIVDAIPDTKLGRHVASQLVRCGTSAPPNYDESGAAESDDDFIHKLSVALKELRETRGWLRYIVKAELLSKSRMAHAIDESEQLCRILGKSVVTAKARRKRRRESDD